MHVTTWMSYGLRAHHGLTEPLAYGLKDPVVVVGVVGVVVVVVVGGVLVVVGGVLYGLKPPVCAAASPVKPGTSSPISVAVVSTLRKETSVKHRPRYFKGCAGMFSLQLLKFCALGAD
jgi:predicted membrane channel-forming protein YqfA (hemolysin III family)